MADSPEHSRQSEERLSLLRHEEDCDESPQLSGIFVSCSSYRARSIADVILFVEAVLEAVQRCSLMSRFVDRGNLTKEKSEASLSLFLS